MPLSRAGGTRWIRQHISRRHPAASGRKPRSPPAWTGSKSATATRPWWGVLAFGTRNGHPSVRPAGRPASQPASHVAREGAWGEEHDWFTNNGRGRGWCVDVALWACVHALHTANYRVYCPPPNSAGRCIRSPLPRPLPAPRQTPRYRYQGYIPCSARHSVLRNRPPLPPTVPGGRIGADVLTGWSLYEARLRGGGGRGRGRCGCSSHGQVRSRSKQAHDAKPSIDIYTTYVVYIHTYISIYIHT